MGDLGLEGESKLGRGGGVRDISTLVNLCEDSSIGGYEPHHPFRAWPSAPNTVRFSPTYT